MRFFTTRSHDFSSSLDLRQLLPARSFLQFSVDSSRPRIDTGWENNCIFVTLTWLNSGLVSQNTPVQLIKNNTVNTPVSLEEEVHSPPAAVQIARIQVSFLHQIPESAQLFLLGLGMFSVGVYFRRLISNYENSLEVRQRTAPKQS
jgi:hypothetical protein